MLQGFDGNQSGIVTVVEVSRVVGDFIAQVDQLGFDGRAQVRQVFVKERRLIRREVTRVFEDAFADFKREIQSGETRVRILK